MNSVPAHDTAVIDGNRDQLFQGGTMHNQYLQGTKSSLVRIIVVAALILAAHPGPATAQQNNSSSVAVPQIIQFSGTLGNAPSGTVSITFTLYENEQGGTALWSGTQNVQVDAQGHYTALLGSASPEGLPLNLFTNAQAHWLAVRPLLEGYGEQPRVLLVSAPYALKAGDAETVGGLPASAFLRAAPGSSSGSESASSGSPGVSIGQPVPPPVTGSGTKNYISIWKSSTALANSAIYQTGGKVGVGTTSPASTLDVNGLVNTSAAYNLGGSAVLAEPGGSGTGNIALGYQALLSETTGFGNTASGYQALNLNTTGTQNTASGTDALQSNTVGDQNTATGFYALKLNTGSYNTASGSGALGANTTGTTNTASGSGTLQSNTIGNYNMADGAYALSANTTGSNNMASGYQALFSSTTASYNTASGEIALINTTTGSNNTADGGGALYNNTTGSNNIAIGYNAAGSVSGGNSNNIEIGNQGSSGDSGAIRIGADGTQTSSYIAGIYGVMPPTAGQPLVCIDSSGQLGTANCATKGGPSAEQEAINRQQQQQIQTLQKQNDELQQRMSRLESLIVKK
jgi:hypothetical protein